MVKIAIIITNYNDSRFLINCVESAIDQNPTEIIIVDDHSSDNSVELIKQLQVRYPSIKFINNDGPQGIFYAFMKGVMATDCDYISCGGAADDQYLYGNLTVFKELINKYPFVDLYLCGAKVLKDNRIYERRLFPFLAYLSPEYFLKICKAGLGFKLNVAGGVIKRDALIKIYEAGGRDMRIHFDCIYNFLSIFDKGCVISERFLYLYRSYFNCWGSSANAEEIKATNRIQLDICKNLLDGYEYRLVQQSGIYSNHDVLPAKIKFFLLKMCPLFIRRIYYKWFY